MLPVPKLRNGWLCLLPILCLAGSALADSSTLSYQGVLRDNAGESVADGPYPMTFSLWDDATAGTNLWNEAHPGISVLGGAFSVQLGSSTPLGNLFATHDSLWLEVSVDTGSGLVVYNPRVPISASPYSFQAGDADTVDGAHAAALEESAEIDADITAHNADANAHNAMQIEAAQINSGKIDNARLNTGSGNGLDADTVDGAQAAALEESAEIDADIAAHNTDAGAHANLAIDAAQIASGVLDNARLNTGSGSGLDADMVDGVHAADLEESGEITAAVAAHNTDGAAHPDIRQMAVPIGTIIPVYIGLTGVPSTAALQASGWALCDGTTPASQGIVGAAVNSTPDLNNAGRFLRGGTLAGVAQADNVGTHSHTASFSGATDNQGTHSHTVSGTTSTDGNHQHLEAGVHINDALGFSGSIVNGGSPKNAFSGPTHGANSNTAAAGNHSHTVTGSTNSTGGHVHSVTGTVTVVNNSPGGETRPVNMSMVFFIRVR